MKCFTDQTLSHEPLRVLAACEQEGGVIIRYPDGRQFELVPRTATQSGGRKVPDFRARQQTIFGKKRFTSRQLNQLFKAIKGRQ